MNENEKPALGSTEAAVLTVVELIARAASMSEQHLSYWLDLYYQVRFKHEAAEIYGELAERTAAPDPVMARLDELEKKIDELKNGVTLKMGVRPVHPAPYRTAEDVIRIRQGDLAADQDPAAAFIKQFAEEEEPEGVERLPDGAFKGQTGTFRKGKDEPHDVEMEEQTPVMRGRETIKLQERAKSETRSETVKRQKAAEREFKIRVANRLRDVRRTRGVTIGEIVTASCGKVPDGAVMTILEGGFRPIADYRALDAALDQLAKNNTSSVTAEP